MSADHCGWIYNERDDSWDTDCENKFQISNNDTPKQNGFVYCPYCGDPIREMHAVMEEKP